MLRTGLSYAQSKTTPVNGPCPWEHMRFDYRPPTECRRKNGHSAVVVDPQVPVLKAMFARRMKTYKSLGFKVRSETEPSLPFSESPSDARQEGKD